MLIPSRLHDGIRDGSVTVAFRAWKRPTVKAGGTLQTPAGQLAIVAVDVIIFGFVCVAGGGVRVRLVRGDNFRHIQFFALSLRFRP